MFDDALLDEAIAAFDAGNHAWGRYRHFVLPAVSAVVSVPTDDVRSALQEAAISVPDARSGAIGPFVSALGTARGALKKYRTLLPEDVPSGEVNQALDAIEEALALLYGRTPPA